MFTEAIANGFKGETCGTVENAFKKAIHLASTNDAIFIGGSTFVVADYFQMLKNEGRPS